ncbi:MAG: hypothetical protein JW880_05510 [Candidatus Thermoplasmatota archaeon]|nr:hypothetical protein [Candidatus Thermoplasmatota archaeon]
MGRLELPLPELGRSLEESAKKMQAMIRDQVPEKFKGSIRVRPFRKGGKTGLEISFDDRAENIVYSAIEYPKGSERTETVEPER